jgi:hypothetical protein
MRAILSEARRAVSYRLRISLASLDEAKSSDHQLTKKKQLITPKKRKIKPASMRYSPLFHKPPIKYGRAIS